MMLLILLLLINGLMKKENLEQVLSREKVRDYSILYMMALKSKKIKKLKMFSELKEDIQKMS